MGWRGQQLSNPPDGAAAVLLHFYPLLEPPAPAGTSCPGAPLSKHKPLAVALMRPSFGPHLACPACGCTHLAEDDVRVRGWALKDIWRLDDEENLREYDEAKHRRGTLPPTRMGRIELRACPTPKEYGIPFTSDAEQMQHMKLLITWE
jgi:hypothetical protein